jgi:teichoic acid transport system ATP-binding protein
MTTDAIITVEGISKCYKLYDSNRDRLKEALHPFKKKYHRHFWALRDIDFHVRNGQTVGVIGVNGSGKSTLLQIICGILQPTTGQARVNGRITALLELGSGFNPEFTGRENVYLQGAILGMSRREIDTRYQAIVDFADIGGFIDQPVKTYSSGMMVRLAFSVAINVDPDVLIVDEALSVGDVFFQAKCFDRMKRMRDRGITSLLVSHNLSTIKALCDHVILLDKGRIVSRGDPVAIVDAYQKCRASSLGSVDLPETPSPLSEPVSPPDTEPLGESADPHVAPSDSPSNVDEDPRIISNGRTIPRYGNGKARLIRFSINGKENCPEISVQSGEELVVHLTHQVSQPIAQPFVAIRIRTKHGVETYGNNTTFGGREIGTVQPGDMIRCVFRQKMHLNNGQFLLTMTIAEWVQNQVVFVDRVVDAVLLNVHDGPYPYAGICNLQGTIEVEHE